MPLAKSDFEYIDELLGSKLTWRILRVLVMYPFLSFRLTDLASKLNTSNKSILRIIRKLIENGLVLGTVGSHTRYRINPDMRMARKIWSIFMSERIERIPRNVIDTIWPYFDVIKYKTDAFIICEYPSPEGMTIFKMKTCVVVVSDRWSIDDISPVPSDVAIYLFPKQQFCSQENPLVQSALLGGIVLRGEDFVFSVLKSLRSFPKLYISEKLDIYGKALSQNDIYGKELERRQLELINKNIHIFESQLDIREYKNVSKTLAERVEDLKAVVARNNFVKYI